MKRGGVGPEREGKHLITKRGCGGWGWGFTLSEGTSHYYVSVLRRSSCLPALSSSSQRGIREILTNVGEKERNQEGSNSKYDGFGNGPMGKRDSLDSNCLVAGRSATSANKGSEPSLNEWSNIVFLIDIKVFGNGKLRSWKYFVTEN